MKKLILPLAVIFFSLLCHGVVFAAEEDLTSIRLKTDFNIWKVYLNRTDWVDESTKLFWNKFEIKLPEYMNEDTSEETLGYLQESAIKNINHEEVRQYLEKNVVPEIHREKQDVKIGLDDKGEVVFEGFAMSGQEIDFDKAFYLINHALSVKEEDVRLPIKTIPPEVSVESEELIDKGIVALLGMGETDFSGSPYNRRNNISVGLNSFNGKLIEPGAEAGAGKILGYVGKSTGYLPELVIKGDKTIPEYGGGLCQVSTTIYRSLLFSGLPITERKNHSYAVSYYNPQGLDATIYPPSPDLKFINDTPNHILIQTTTIGDKAYSNIYGTPVDRHVDLIGPYRYDYRGIPPPKTEYSSELAPGEKKIVGGAHAGFKVSWYRRISYADESKEDVIEHIFSSYEARPLYTIIGEEVPDNSGVPSRN